MAARISLRLMPANLLNAYSVHAPGRSVNAVTVSAAGRYVRGSLRSPCSRPELFSGKAGTSAWNGVCNGLGMLPGGRADAGHPGLVAGAQSLDPVAQVFQSLQGLLEGLHRLLACLFGGCSLTSVASPELGKVGHRRSFELGPGSAQPDPRTFSAARGASNRHHLPRRRPKPHLIPLATSLARDGPGHHWESTAPGRQGEGRGTRSKQPAACDRKVLLNRHLLERPSPDGPSRHTSRVIAAGTARWSHPQVRISGRGGQLPGTYQGRRGPRPLRGTVNGPGAVSCSPSSSVRGGRRP
jgi:hypothetical protein